MVTTFRAVKKSEPVALLSPGDTLEANKWSRSGEVDIRGSVTGELVLVGLIITGVAAPINPEGEIVFFEQDPGFSIASNDSIPASIWPTVVGSVDIITTNWVSDANGAAAVRSTAIPFSDRHVMYAAFLLDPAAANMVMGLGTMTIITQNREEG